MIEQCALTAGSSEALREDSTDHQFVSSSSGRLAWVKYYYATRNATAVCERFSISRRTLRKWVHRYEEARGNPSSLIDRSRRPNRSPRATPTKHVQLLLRARSATGFGRRRLRVYLKETYNISLAEATVAKILRQYKNLKSAYYSLPD
jgi:transposase